MNILAFAASFRKESLNRKLIDVAVRIAREKGATVDLADFREFEMPMYDGDLDAASGLPPGGLELKRRIEAADGLMIASPEYNYSLPGTLKNAIDWVSRSRPMPLRGKSAVLLAASTSLVGGIRGLWQLRIPLEGLGVYVHPDMFSLASANQAFDEPGALKDSVMHERLERIIESYLKMAKALASQ